MKPIISFSLPEENPFFPDATFCSKESQEKWIFFWE
jgi:hypothetical protein